MEDTIFHGRVYDPVKAREYYLRTRKLKGRQSSARIEPVSSSGRISALNKPPANDKPEKSKYAKMRAEKEALERRLARLREALALLVDSAQARSGVDPKDSPKDKAAKNEEAKKKLSPKERKEKAKQAREKYEKEAEKTPISQELAALRTQVQAAQAQLKAALESARRGIPSSSGKASIKPAGNPSIRPAGRPTNDKTAVSIRPSKRT